MTWKRRPSPWQRTAETDIDHAMCRDAPCEEDGSTVTEAYTKQAGGTSVSTFLMAQSELGPTDFNTRLS